MRIYKTGVPAILAVLLAWLSLCPAECVRMAAAGPAEQSPVACHAEDSGEDSEVRCQECWSSSRFLQTEKFQLLYSFAVFDSPQPAVDAELLCPVPSVATIADPPLLLRQSPVLLI